MSHQTSFGMLYLRWLAKRSLIFKSSNLSHSIWETLYHLRGLFYPVFPWYHISFSLQTMNLIRPKLSKLFYDSGPKKTIPKCAIKVVPWFHSEAVFHSYSESKSISCKVPSLQMLPFFVENFGPKYTEWTTTAHEQLPGHHLEVIHSKTKFKQKFISFLFRRIHVTRFML